ncbi:hypothetical protein R3I94_022760 [Phoxinus phoxinus]|uniref:Uncharacterized protein n=1 Tax=Phoxinus phoxinus TaxID=58324 RepID=A0AAN9C5Z8_9TELE
MQREDVKAEAHNCSVSSPNAVRDGVQMRADRCPEALHAAVAGTKDQTGVQIASARPLEPRARRGQVQQRMDRK